MIPYNNIRTLFFDYDGCLHNSIKIYAPAFKKAYAYLVMKGLAEQRNWEDNEISCWLGFNSVDMWKAFMPDIDEHSKRVCSSIISEEMNKLISQGKPELYEGALEVLLYLKEKGYHLVFISNCKTYYKDAHRKLFRLDEYFVELVCSEDYGFVPKAEILKKIKGRYPKDMVMIGDRMQDIEAGKKNGMYTIGCSYGFSKENELDSADVIINNILELKSFF